MRIVLFNQYYPPAEAPTATLAADLCRALVADGHDVSVVCCSRSYNDPRRRYVRRELLDEVSVRRTWTSGFGRGGRLVRLLDYLTYLVGAAWALLRLRRTDVVISMTTPPLLASWLLPIIRWRRTKLLYWVMDIYPDLAFELGVMKRNGMLGRLLERLSRSALTYSDCVVSLGSDMAERLRQQGAEEVAVIDNWCDGEQISPQPNAENAYREELGWGDRTVFLYSGNMGMAHEFETLVEAAVRLRERGDIHFAFVGGGARLPEIQRSVDERQLSNVSFHPWVPQDRLRDGLTAGDVHLVTLRDDLWGYLVPSKVYGVLAAGRPTIFVGPEKSYVVELIREGQCGFESRVGDVDALVRSVTSYADDASLRATHGERARSRFEERYDREIALERFSKLVERIAPIGRAGQA